VSDTITLYRPAGQKELNLIRDSGYTAFPPRLPEQPIFYPVLNEEYATKIARLERKVQYAQSGLRDALCRARRVSGPL
jgi:hypothetical protein